MGMDHPGPYSVVYDFGLAVKLIASGQNRSNAVSLFTTLIARNIICSVQLKSNTGH